MKRTVVVLALLAACGGKVPETRYYQLNAPHEQRAPGEAVVVLEPLETDAAYDDDRIVYRTSPYRLDYYQYHRWTGSPGNMVSDFLARGLQQSGHFRAITRELSDAAPVVVGGRLIAIEEIDRSKTEWLGRITMEIVVTDSKSGAPVWSQQFDETEPLAEQTPEGLAAALSKAMTRIVAKAAPSIADAAARQQEARAQAKGDRPRAMAERVPPTVTCPADQKTKTPP
jgi:uncharacterized lipoprotein YmbA